MPNIRHAFISTKADVGDTSVVHPSNWNAPLQYTDAIGNPSGTNVAVRTKLLADTTFYVATTGSDTTGDGSIGSPWATIQHAINYFQQNIDAGGQFKLTLQVADGTYNESVFIPPITGVDYWWQFFLTGNQTTPSNCVINSTSDTAVSFAGPMFTEMSGFKVSAVVDGVHCSQSCTLYWHDMNWGTCGNACLDVDTFSYAFSDSTTDIVSGNSTYFFQVTEQGFIQLQGVTITASGTRTFTIFAFLESLGLIEGFLGTNTFPGTYVGKRYQVDYNSVVNISGAGPNFFPGNSAGTTSLGGQYN